MRDFYDEAVWPSPATHICRSGTEINTGLGLFAVTASLGRPGWPRPAPECELLIDLEEDRAARAVVFGLLAEMERQ